MGRSHRITPFVLFLALVIINRVLLTWLLDLLHTTPSIDETTLPTQMISNWLGIAIATAGIVASGWWILCLSLAAVARSSTFPAAIRNRARIFVDTYAPRTVRTLMVTTLGTTLTFGSVSAMASEPAPAHLHQSSQITFSAPMAPESETIRTASVHGHATTTSATASTRSAESTGFLESPNIGFAAPNGTPVQETSTGEASPLKVSAESPTDDSLSSAGDSPQTVAQSSAHAAPVSQVPSEQEELVPISNPPVPEDEPSEPATTTGDHIGFLEPSKTATEALSDTSQGASSTPAPNSALENTSRPHNLAKTADSNGQTPQASSPSATPSHTPQRSLNPAPQHSSAERASPSPSSAKASPSARDASQRASPAQTTSAHMSPGHESAPHSTSKQPATESTHARAIVVQPGDCLWDIAERLSAPNSTNLHIAQVWQQIYQHNLATIGANPDVILSGMILEIPQTLRS